MPTCFSCGGNFDDSFQFCPYCGKSKPDLPKNDVNLNISVAQGINACPNCKSNNRVEKITTIFKSQTSQTQGQMPVETVHTSSEGEVYSSTGYRDYSASHSSNLAQQLAPPKKPMGNSYGFCLAYAVFMMIGGGFIGIFFVFFGLMMAISTLSVVFSSSSPSQAIGTGIMGVILSSGLILVPIALWFMYFFLFRYFRKKKVDDQKRLDETEGVAWQKAMNRWDKSYYCYRCDCIFVPGEQSVPSREMWSHVYKTT